VCTILTKQQRPVTMPMAINGYSVIHTTSSSVIVLVHMSGGGSMPVPDVAFDLRTDQPTSMPNVSQLYSPMGTMQTHPLSLVTAARTADNTGTLILATDNNVPWLYNWPDNNNSAPMPSSGNNGNASLAGAAMLDTPSGIFYALADQQGSMNNTCPTTSFPCGTFLDWENGRVPPTIGPPSMLDSVPDHSLSDSGFARTYVLSDGSAVSLLYSTPDPMNANNYQLSQASVKMPAGGATVASSTRVILPQGGMPLTFQRNGTNVDVGIVAPGQNDAGQPVYNAYFGEIPESKVFTFNVTTDLKKPDVFDALGIGANYNGPPPCWATAGGKMLMLISAGTNPGLNTIGLDIPKATISLSMLGASNLLTSDANVLSCSLAFASASGTQYVYDLVWADNAGGTGMETLNYAPLVCNIP
jgi:hypothetical protein